MARAWTSSRTLIGGTSPRTAALDIGDTIMGQLSDWGQDMVDAEYRRQTSNAGIAIEQERHALANFMAEHATDPGSWRAELAKNNERIRKSVMSGVTQPRARQAVELELNEWMAATNSWLDASAAKQTAAITNTDWETGMAGFEESVQYQDDTDVTARISAANAHIDRGWNGGKKPVNALPWHTVVEARRRDVEQSIVGDYLVQESLRSGDDAMIDRANELAPALTGRKYKEPLFGPEKLVDLKKRIKTASNAAKAEMEQKVKAEADAFEQKATNDMLAGRLTFTDEKGNTVNWRDAIVANQYISPAVKRTLEGEYDEQANALSKRKDYDDLQKVEAYNELSIEIDPEKKRKLIRKHAAGLGFEKLKPFIDDMTNPDKSGDFSHVAKSLDATISAVRTMRQKVVADDDKMGDSEKAAETAKINAALARQESRIFDLWRAHPEWTAKQRIDEMEAILAPVKDEAAKETVKKVSLWTRLGRAPTTPFAFGGGLPGEPPVSEDQPPAGLEKYWAKLTPERKAKARTLIQRGVPMNRIIEALEK